jgi:hypothetical protein
MATYRQGNEVRFEEIDHEAHSFSSSCAAAARRDRGTGRRIRRLGRSANILGIARPFTSGLSPRLIDLSGAFAGLASLAAKQLMAARRARAGVGLSSRASFG